MALSVTNTLRGEREEFEVDGDEVLLYVCGLTVSDDAHLGHARVWVHADVIHRWLEHRGYEVRHVENFTDVNEKIVARIGEDDLGDDELAVSNHFIARIIDDMRGLNLERAEVYPRVSEHVPEIVDLIERLLDRGYAYEANGSVYFDVTAFEEYGALSNQSLDDLEAQGDPAERREKRHPADFALWKADGVAPADVEEHRTADAAPPEEAVTGAETWDSPWGEGRPGWHVECSAMSMAHLDETIDVHLGGHDLIFPHHENEIAQSEAATGERFARYWLHTGLLETEGEKMSSSLGNFFYVTDALAEFGPNVLRTFYLGADYGTNQAFSEDALREAEERWERLDRAHERAVEACDSVDARTKVADGTLRAAVDEARERFAAAMDDDFGVREATAALLDLARTVNRHVDGRAEYDYRGLRRAIETFEELAGDVFGLQFEEPSDGTAGLADDLVDLVLDLREAERAAGNYDRADALREDLAALGIEVEDGATGPTYRIER
ncbi:MAG: cysteine--tRNA ligase [Haloferacaceae archaeon]